MPLVVAILNVPPFSVINNRPSGIEITAHGFTRLVASTCTSSGVLVFTPATLVCPAKAGLYCGLLGAFVSTGGHVPVGDD